MNFVTPKEVGYLPQILKARSFLQLELSDRQKQILIGSVLGDAYIYPLGKVQFEQSEKQKDYLFWKYEEFKNLAYGEPSKVIRTDKRTGQKYSSHRFWLRQYFRPWREIFYKGKMKIFPEWLELTPISLSVWYGDDGCFSDGTCTISTESFNNDSLKIIQQKLGNLELETWIRSNGKLGIRSSSHKRFSDLIRSEIHPSLQYKIP